MKEEPCKGMLCLKESAIKKIAAHAPALLKLNPFRLRYPGRPLLLAEFGRITWDGFHRICAYFSAKPSEKESEAMRRMFDGFAHFFPCENCKEDLIQQMKEMPSGLKNNVELSRWFLKVHNNVNEKLKQEPIKTDINDFISSYLI